MKTPEVVTATVVLQRSGSEKVLDDRSIWRLNNESRANVVWIETRLDCEFKVHLTAGRRVGRVPPPCVERRTRWPLTNHNGVAEAVSDIAERDPKRASEATVPASRPTTHDTYVCGVRGGRPRLVHLGAMRPAVRRASERGNKGTE